MPPRDLHKLSLQMLLILPLLYIYIYIHMDTVMAEQNIPACFLLELLLSGELLLLEAPLNPHSTRLFQLF